jgi:hypothetical protein
VGSTARLIYAHGPVRLRFHSAHRLPNGAVVLEVNVLNRGTADFDPAGITISEVDRRHPVSVGHEAEPCPGVASFDVIEPGDDQALCILYSVRRSTRHLDFDDERDEVSLQVPRVP